MYITETKKYKLLMVFKSIRNRCNNKNVKFYKDYGWRWIKCKWKTFKEFYKDMWNTYKKWLQIDRENNNWNYCKENCRWITHKEQQRNKRNNIIIDGITLPEFCEKYNLNYKQTINRKNRWYSNKQLIANKNIYYKKVIKSFDKL